MPTHYLAIDLGDESGRVMLGTLKEGRFALEELHRFPNTPVTVDGSLTWSITMLFEEVKAGLRKAAARRLPIASLSTDSWGVDYILFDEAGAVISPTFHCREARTARSVETVKSRENWKSIFDATGFQFMPLSTIFQLVAGAPERLKQAAQILTIADAFNYLLCGVERELHEEERLRTALHRESASLPHQPRGQGHHRVERRPDRPEDPAGRIPRGLCQSRIPLARHEERT